MRIVVDVRNGIFRDAVVKTLRDFSADFDVYASESPLATAELCAVTGADVLLMEVTGYPRWRLEDRMVIRDMVKADNPACKVVLAVDENSERKLAEQVRNAKKEGRIDQFVYGSISAAYLSAVIDTL